MYSEMYRYVHVCTCIAVFATRILISVCCMLQQGIYMYTCICVCIHTYACTYTYISVKFTFTYLHVHSFICISTFMAVSIFVCRFISVFLYLHVYLHPSFLHLHECFYILLYTYVHIYICIYIIVFIVHKERSQACEVPRRPQGLSCAISKTRDYSVSFREPPRGGFKKIEPRILG